MASSNLRPFRRHAVAPLLRFACFTGGRCYFAPTSKWPLFIFLWEFIVSEPFDHETFFAEVNRYGDWISAAYKAGELGQCRRRTEAALLWLEQQRQLAPADMHRGLDAAAAEMKASVANMPKVEGDQAVIGPPAPESVQSYVEVAQGIVAELEEELESKLDLFPPNIARDVAFCIAASSGLESQESSPYTCDQTFAILLRSFMRAAHERDNSALATAAVRLRTWAAITSMHSGFSRDELVRRVESLTDVSELESPSPVPNGT